MVAYREPLQEKKVALVGAFVGAVAWLEPKDVGVGLGGVISCRCGHSACPRDEQGKVITRHYYEAVHLVASKGYTCPKCGLFIKGMTVSAQTIKSWKRKFPDWDWQNLEIKPKVGGT